jgi:integrase/recombinase XerD
MPPTVPHLRLLHNDPMKNLTGYEPWLRANNCGDNTIEDRLGALGEFARKHPDFPYVKPSEITAWIGRPGYAQWTRATYFGHLRSYFRFAIDIGIMDVDPMVKMRRPKPGKGIPRPLNSVQVKAILGAANPVTYTCLILALYAGLRAHEIAKIRGEDVEEDSLYVFGKGGQGKFLPTHPLVWAEALKRPRYDWWFPSGDSHLKSPSVTNMATRLFAANGIEGSIHRCRHTYGTELLRAGVNIRVVQTLMRHESLNSTMIYTAVDEDERRDAINRLSAA